MTDNADILTKEEINDILGPEPEKAFFSMDWFGITNEQMNLRYSNNSGYLKWIFSVGRFYDPFLSKSERRGAENVKYASPFVPLTYNNSFKDSNFMHIYWSSDTQEGRFYPNFGIETGEKPLKTTISKNGNSHRIYNDFGKLQELNPHTDVVSETAVNPKADLLHETRIRFDVGHKWIRVPDKENLDKARAFYRANKKLSDTEKNHLAFAAVIDFRKHKTNE